MFSVEYSRPSVFNEIVSGVNKLAQVTKLLQARLSHNILFYLYNATASGPRLSNYILKLVLFAVLTGLFTYPACFATLLEKGVRIIDGLQ